MSDTKENNAVNAMQVTISKEGGNAELKLSGRFDFKAHRNFLAAYESSLADNKISSVTINMAGVVYMDSSALGMLLILREKAAAANKTLKLSNVRGAVKNVLDIANFNKLFIFV